MLSNLHFLQDIAVDGWVITILSQENRPYGSLAQTLGLTLGGIIGFNIFIPLNSVMFCNTYLYHLPKEVLLCVKSLVKS